MSDNLQQFKAADKKFNARREYAAIEPVKWSSKALFTLETLAKALAEVDIGEILPDDTRQTFAIGLLSGTTLVVSNKGVTNGDTYIETIYKKLAHLQGMAPTVEYTKSPEAGLHGEMAVVGHVIAKSQDAKKAVWDLQYLLQICCIGKPVCPDCAGWLNKHMIPHCSLVRDNDAVKLQYACGKPSQGGQWKHPRTNAFYQSEGKASDPKLNTWQKNGVSINRPLFY